MYRTQKLINQFLDKVSTQISKVYAYVCENSERYDCKNARWIKKTMQCMS